LINLADMQNTRHTSNSSRLNGCCGPDGCDGPNTLCLCGVEIGTERSDCWMPTSLSFVPAMVDPRRRTVGRAPSRRGPSASTP
jgi:hypothetical protein